jgi:hypothetical protein
MTALEQSAELGRKAAKATQKSAIQLGMGPLGYMPENRETDGGMSLAPKGFEAAVIRARVQESRLLANRSCERYDYEKQAWTVKWHYMSCNHPRSRQCKCYGKLHEGELAEDFRNRTLQSEERRFVNAAEPEDRKALVDAFNAAYKEESGY